MIKVDIIGAGLSSLYAACFLSKKGHTVNVYEKNESVGGRSRVFEQEGFKFDMGPSWYWMPDLIDDLFSQLGEDRRKYFDINRLDPSYKVFWKNTDPTEIPADKQKLFELFDTFEEKGGEKLEKFLEDAHEKYTIAVPEFLEKPGLKLGEVINLNVLKKALQMDVFKSVDKDVSNRFTSPKSIGILNFPVLFLGEMPNRIPSLYTLMNHADMGLGTWYPNGGMSQLPLALMKIAEKNGAKFHFNAPVTEFSCQNDKIQSFVAGGKTINTDYVIAGADYNFVEQNLVPKKYRRYTESYWDKRSLAPSCLIYYIGTNKKIDGLDHHNLFFDEDINTHGNEIYKTPKWPEKPLFYACVPSKTDNDVAPENCENIFLLVPIAPDLDDTPKIRADYFELIIKRMEKQVGVAIKDHVIFKKDFCISDFKADYNAFKGNAYGLANTLKQTANLKPKITSKLKNLFFCGQLTVPGPGIPPSLMSGKIVAKHVLDKFS